MGIESPPVNKAITGERARVLLLMILILATYLFLAYAAYSVFTSQIPSGNDFYSRWRGTRALLLEGKDPYSEEVTLEIQRGMYGRPARGDEDQRAENRIGPLSAAGSMKDTPSSLVCKR